MSRKLGLLTALIIVLAGTLGLAFKVQRVEASGTIYIRADGSVDPPTANITSVDDITYTFTGNIYDEMVVERSDMTIDGNGYIIQGSGGGYAFNLTSISNVTIKNIIIKGFDRGIYLDSTFNSIISGNNLDYHYYGITLTNSGNNTISNNVVANSLTGMKLWKFSKHNLISHNVMVGNNDGIVMSSSTGLNIVESNVLIDNKWCGISVTSNGNILANNTVTNYSDEDFDGIVLVYSRNNLIHNNSVFGNNGMLKSGIELLSSDNNTVCENTILYASYWAIDLSLASNNNITRNTVAYSKRGILLIANRSLGFGNTIFHNNFINNTYQFQIGSSSHNTLDNGYEGNYWSDYNGNDLDKDGIGDSPYIIDKYNRDNCPLMGMFSSFNTLLGTHVNVISNSTIEDFEYFESNSTIRMYVSGGEGFGFCRISISHVLMNVSNISVVIDDSQTPVLHSNYTLYDNGTHRWIYFAYEHSTHEIDIIPEFPSLLILPPFMIATLLAVIVYKRKRTS